MRHSARRDAAAADEIKQDDTHLVAGDQAIAAFAVGDGGAAAVAVRVGADQDVGLDFVAEFEALLHRLADLGVWIRAGREMAVRVLLLGHDGHVLDAELPGQHPHTLESGAVERRIDELQLRDARAIADALGVDGIDEFFKDCVRDIRDRPGGEGRVKVRTLRRREEVQLFDHLQNDVCGLRRDLAAVRTIDLIAVVLRGIVAGGDADADAAVQLAHSKAQRRNRLEPGIEMCGDAVCGEDRRGLARKHVGADAAVVGNGGTLRQLRAVQIVGNGLCGAADDIDVHAVRARAKDAAQTGGAEF